MSTRKDDLDKLANRYNELAKNKNPNFVPMTADDIINIANLAVKSLVIQDKVRRAPTSEKIAHAHDVAMTFSDMFLLSLILLKLLKYEKFDCDDIEAAIWDITKEFPSMIRYIWDNMDAYFPTITYSELKRRISQYE